MPDLKVAWSYRIREGIAIQPSAGFYNVFNFANFDLPGTALNGLLTGAPGQINGTTRAGHNVDRVGVGTEVYSLARLVNWSLGCGWCSGPGLSFASGADLVDYTRKEVLLDL